LRKKVREKEKDSKREKVEKRMRAGRIKIERKMV
jgi:hypothetical protein